MNNLLEAIATRLRMNRVPVMCKYGESHLKSYDDLEYG